MKWLRRHWKAVAGIVGAMAVIILLLPALLLSISGVYHGAAEVTDKIPSGGTGEGSSRVDNTQDFSVECTVSIDCSEVTASPSSRTKTVSAYSSEKFYFDLNAPTVSKDTSYSCTFSADCACCSDSDSGTIIYRTPRLRVW